MKFVKNIDLMIGHTEARRGFCCWVALIGLVGVGCGKAPEAGSGSLPPSTATTEGVSAGEAIGVSAEEPTLPETPPAADAPLVLGSREAPGQLPRAWCGCRGGSSGWGRMTR